MNILDEINAKLDKLLAAQGASTTAPAKAVKPAAAPGLSYDDIKTPFLELCKTHGRDAGVAICTQFGAKTLKDVKPEQYTDVLEAIKKTAAEAAIA